MTMRMLAFNTSTELCSVALMIDQKVYKCNIITPQSHSEKILCMIDRLLIDTGVLLKSIDCIVFDKGPGSFVGIRIGIGIAQGLALGADLPLIGVSSLNVLAQGAWRVFSMKQVIAVIDACMKELYWSHYSLDSDDNNNFFWKSTRDMCLVTLLDVQKIIRELQGKWALVGTGWDINYQLRKYIESSNVITLKRLMFPEAQDMLVLGMYAFKNKIFTPLDQTQPLYFHSNFIKKQYVNVIT